MEWVVVLPISRTESASVTIFDSINRFANNAPDLVKVGLHKICHRG